MVLPFSKNFCQKSCHVQSPTQSCTVTLRLRAVPLISTERLCIPSILLNTVDSKWCYFVTINISAWPLVGCSYWSMAGCFSQRKDVHCFASATPVAYGVTKLWGVEHKRLVLQRAQMWNQISYTGIISLSPRSYNVNKSDVEFHLKIVTQIMIPHWTMHINFCAIYTLKCFGQAGHFASPVYVIVSGAEDKPHTLLCRAARAQRPSTRCENVNSVSMPEWQRLADANTHDSTWTTLNSCVTL